MKLYFFKENPKQFQIFPVPENLEDFLVVEVESEAEAYGKQAIVNDRGEVELVEIFDLEEAKKELLEKIKTKADALYEEYLEKYSKVERATFIRQIQEAKTYLEQLIKLNQSSKSSSKTTKLSDNKTSVTSEATEIIEEDNLNSILDNRAKQLNISKEKLAQVIIAKNQERFTFENTLALKVMDFRVKVNKAETKTEVEEIKMEVENWSLNDGKDEI